LLLLGLISSSQTKKRLGVLRWAFFIRLVFGRIGFTRTVIVKKRRVKMGKENV